MTTNSKKIAVGIDLGTTYSLAATLDGGEPRVLRNRLGETLIPSVVSVDVDGSILAGAPALARGHYAPSSTARWFKRDMGTSKKFKLDNREFTPESLSALILSEVRAAVEEGEGCELGEAVVTVPAYFGETQRRATRDACELAGLHVERIINEPTAAALAYGLHQRDNELRCAVLDLGGGTFDVTILEIFEGVIEIQSSAGDARLGGEDFADVLTTTLADQLATRYRARVPPGGAAWARLREAAEQLKKELSTTTTKTTALPNLATDRGEIDVELELSREAAEAAWGPLLERMRAPVRRALSDASAAASEIDEVILVGGATRMPCVVGLAAQLFGRLPLRTLPPDEAVAIGAAIQVALKRGDAAVDDMVVTDVAPFSIGIAVSERVGTQFVAGLFSPILERGTVLPVSRVEVFSTMQNRQTVLEVEIFQGEHSLCKHNTFLGKFDVTGIPPRLAGEEQVEVRFTYDLNGILEVDATVVSTKKTTSFVIEKNPGRLSPRELKAARKQMSSLKFHPRDALPNVTALNRAEAVYQELNGQARAILGESMAALRLAIEGQSPKEIADMRSMLVAQTERLRR